MTTEFSWPNALSTLLRGEHPSEEQASGAMTEIMEGAATPAQIAGFVIASNSGLPRARAVAAHGE